MKISPDELHRLIKEVARLGRQPAYVSKSGQQWKVYLSPDLVARLEKAAESKVDWFTF